jgi:hypothetical protein
LLPRFANPCLSFSLISIFHGLESRALSVHTEVPTSLVYGPDCVE